MSTARSAAFAIVILNLAGAAVAEPPRYTMQPLSITLPPGMGWAEELGDGLTVLGYGSQGSSCQFVWSDGVYRYVPLACWQSGFSVLLPGGIAAGERRFSSDERSYPAIFDGTNVIDLPTITPPGWIPTGKVVGGTWPGHVYGHAAYKAAQWINGELSLLPVPEGCEGWTPVAASPNGTLMGQGCGGMVLYRDGAVSSLEYPKPIDPPSQGYLYYWDEPVGVNDSGMVVVHRRYVVEIDAGDPISVHHTFVYDGAAWHEIPQFALRELTNDGEVVGGDTLWSGGQIYSVASRVDDAPPGNILVVDAHADGRLLVVHQPSGGGLRSFAVLVPHAPPPPVCRVDWDGNGVVNSTDVSAFINAWFENQATGECP